MKVFIVNPGMVDDYVYELATALSKKTISVFIFGSNDYRGKKVNFNNINFYNYFFDINKNKFIRNLPLLKSILKGISYIFMHVHILYNVKKLKPQIIHFQWSRIALLDYLFLFLYPKIPIVYTMHNTTLNHGDASYTNYFNIGFEKFLNKVSFIIVHTKYSKTKFLENHQEYKNKVDIIPHGLLKFNENKKLSMSSFKFNSNKIILFFGNIQHYKGLDILINAMNYLKDESINLLIVGRDQISLKNLKQLAKKLNVDKNIFWRCEYIKEEEVSEIFRIAKVIILPHRHIDQSGVLMSAINFEIPIIASNIGGFAEIIEDGKNGYLFQKENPKDLALKIKNFFISENLDNMSKQIALLKNSWKTWDEIANDTIKIYQKL